MLVSNSFESCLEEHNATFFELAKFKKLNQKAPRLPTSVHSSDDLDSLPSARAGA